MAAKWPPDARTPASKATDPNAGLNSPFTGSLSAAQLTAQIGRSLQSLYQASLQEPLPEELAALVRQLEEREGRPS
jgi:hypothetical protein